MSTPSGNIEAERILLELNDKQQEAVQCTAGPLLVIAGPGSGKTRVLTSRVAYLIATGKAWPRQILALTFTNKAAREMQRRVINMLPKGIGDGVTMGTFHSVMVRVMREELREGWLPGFTHRFSIYDTDDTERVIRQLMEQHRINKKTITPRVVRSAISRAKNRMITPSQYAQAAKTPNQERIARLFGPYTEALHGANAMDFDDLLLKPLELFRDHPQVLEKYQRRWQYVHIDEYQDTNRVQYLLSRLIASIHTNLCVVGDDAQSIYAFRGADMRNILDFQEDYPDAAVVRLEQNYRSTGKIIRLADSIIKHNRRQLKKDLWTQNDSGDHITLIEALNGRQEAEKATDRIRVHHERHGYAYSDFAVLYRTNAQSRNFEDALRARRVPYRVYGGTSFYQRKEIKDALAYLRLLINKDDLASLIRIINYPSRGIGLKTQERLVDYARFNGISVWAAMEQSRHLQLHSRAKKALMAFLTLTDRHRSRLSSEEPDVVARELLTEAGLFPELEKESTPQSEARVQNVQELISAIAQHTADDSEATLSTFLQSVALLTDADERADSQDTVTLMTLHASKGLEFKVVFIGGLEEELFPSYRAVEDARKKNSGGLEEERRLFYVGVTRAERHLYLAHARSRLRFGFVRDCTPSRFLSEVDQGVTRREGTSPFEGAPSAVTFGGGRLRHFHAPSSSRSLVDPKRTVSQLPKTEAKPISIEAIRPGLHVLHDLFGAGRVVSVSGHGARKTATVNFAERGQMKLMLSFAKLRVLS